VGLIAGVLKSDADFVKLMDVFLDEVKNPV
jgi:Zn-dependent M16 (insulinase) family peptidase